MSEFKKVAIYVNEDLIESSLQPQENRLEYFQNIVDMYYSLNTGVQLEKTDLKALLENPRGFVASRLIKDESISIGGLKLDFEKVFDIIEKPAGTNELIDKIINDLKVRDLMMNQRNVDYFEIENSDTVVLNTEYVAKTREQHTVYLHNEKQVEANKALKIISENINKLTDFKVHGHITSLLFEKYLDVNNSTGKTTVNPYFTKLIY
jgi:hypothetical protein